MTALHGFLGLPSDWKSVGCTASAECPDWIPMLAELQGAPGDPALCNLATSLNLATSDDVLVGYSMGGRIALHMLLAAGGEHWRRAVIISASPGLSHPAERFARLEGDGRWAHRFRHEEWNSVVTAWNDQPVFAADATGFLERDEEQFDREALALALLRGSIGRQDDLRAGLSRLEVPILWMAGELDAKYVALAKESAALNPLFRCAILPQAGHRAPWTASAVFGQAVEEFLGK